MLPPLPPLHTVWLTGCHVDIVLKLAAHWGTGDEVQVGHVQEHRLNLKERGWGAQKGGGQGVAHRKEEDRDLHKKRSNA